MTTNSGLIDLDEMDNKIINSVNDINEDIKLPHATLDQINNLIKNLEVPKKKIDFMADIESKAVVEAIAPVLENFTLSSMMEVMPKLIKHVQKYKNLSGTEKKNMVVGMLRHIVDITDGPGDDAVWDPILKELIPKMVDTIVDLDRGVLKLNTKPKKGLLKTILNLFFGCLKK